MQRDYFKNTNNTFPMEWLFKWLRGFHTEVSLTRVHLQMNRSLHSQEDQISVVGSKSPGEFSHLPNQEDHQEKKQVWIRLEANLPNVLQLLI